MGPWPMGRRRAGGLRPPIDADLAVFESDSTVAVADEEAEESGRGPGPKYGIFRWVLKMDV